MDERSVDIEEYKKAIQSLAKSNSNAFVNSVGPTHAAVVMAEILRNAKEIKLLTGSFSGIVSDSSIYINALREFLTKDGKMEVLLTHYPNLTSLSFNLIAEAQKNNPKISLKILNKSTSDFIERKFNDPDIHFVIGDNKMFRLESDKNTFTSYCSFNDSKTTKELTDVFEKCYKESDLAGFSVQEIYSDPSAQSNCIVLLNEFENVNLEMMEYFSKHPDELHKLHWRKFEELLDAIFKNQGFITELGPGSGDGGVDIRLIQKDPVSPILTLVQVKRYKKENPIRLEAVQALSAIVEHEKANRGLFVTTSRYLPGVEEWVSEQPSRITLANSDNVAEWCKSIVSRRRH